MIEFREFSLEEANALIPELHRVVSQQLWLQHELEEHLAMLHRQTGTLPREMVLLWEDSEEIRALKERIGRLMEEVDSGWGRVQAMGAMVKDPRSGLLDFYGRFEGRLVLLCWRFGEECITYFHELGEGFQGRKPLPPSPCHRLFN